MRIDVKFGCLLYGVHYRLGEQDVEVDIAKELIDRHFAVVLEGDYVPKPQTLEQMTLTQVDLAAVDKGSSEGVETEELLTEDHPRAEHELGEVN